MAVKMDGLSINELNAIRVEIVNEQQDIQTQLGIDIGQRNHGDGTPMTADEYSDWRRRAARALIHRNRDLREVNARLRTLRQDQHGVLLQTKRSKPKTNLKPLIAGLVGIITSMIDDGAEAFPDEQAIIDEATALLELWNEKEALQAECLAST